MTDHSPLPKFRKPPVSEVVIGIQFQAPELTPVHLGSYYQRVKGDFPQVTVHPPLQPVFETFGSPGGMTGLEVGSGTNIPFPAMMNFPFAVGSGAPVYPRVWFASGDGASLIQLQSGRMLFNWRGGLYQHAYPSFGAVNAEFLKALDSLEDMIRDESLEGVSVNQCELLYVNPLTTSARGGIPMSEPERIFRIWSSQTGPEWTEPTEDTFFTARYRLHDAAGSPFGRLIATLNPGWGRDGLPSYHLELSARGQTIGTGRDGITKFHEHAHQAIVRCFTAITTPEMHELWGRYQ